MTSSPAAAAQPVQLFTDGSSRGNPGPGGYAAILRFKQHEKRLAAGYRLTTNNRMELLAVIKGLEALTRTDLPVVVYSDSKYVIDAVEKGWAAGWQKKGFTGKKNPDLWTKLLALLRKYQVRWVWVRGHSGHPENEECDQLAVNAALGNHLLIDEVYEKAVAAGAT